MKYVFNLYFVVLFLVATGREAWAYIDPGTGSMLFQILIGVFFSVFFTIKFWWKRLLGFMYKLTGKQSRDDED